MGGSEMSDTIKFPLAALEQLCNEIDTSASDEIERLTRERDEARNKLADALQEIDLRTLDFERMKQERDEARERAERYRLEANAMMMQRDMKPKINIEDYAEWKNRDCNYKASNGQTYHFEIYRSNYSIVWECQITGEGNRMCHHPDPHLTAAGVKKNAIKFLESALKKRGALNA